MNEFYDVAIIGASISGASLANYLGKEGLRVALIDKDEFPRRKACGEGVSDIALAALRRMGLDADIEAMGGKPFYTYRIDLGKRSCEFTARRHRQLRGVGLQRYRLDRALAEHAARLPSVNSFFGNAVTSVRREDDLHQIDFGSGERMQARRLVLADGANSKIASRLRIPKKKTREPLWGISFILEGSYDKVTGEVVVILKDGFEINCTPVSDSHLNVAFLAEKSRVPYLQDREVRAELLEEAATKAHFRGNPIGDPLQVGPVGSTRRPYFHDSILLLGDVAESLDPIAGMGMTHGILMAEHAAKALVDQLRNGVPEPVALKEYARQAEKMTRPYRGFTQLTSSLLRSPLRNFLVPPMAFASLPDLIRGSLRYHPFGENPLPALPLLLLNLFGA